MRGADFAERFLALFERLVLAAESIAESLVNRKAIHSAPAPAALPAFQAEEASGQRLLSSDERRKAKQREAMRALRANRKAVGALSMPSLGGVTGDAGDVTVHAVGDGCDVTNHHASGDGCDVTTVTCDVTVGGGGGVFQGRSDEISPVFLPKEARREQIAREGGDVTCDDRSHAVTPLVTSHVTAVSSGHPIARLARTARSPTDDGCFGMAVAAWVEGVMSVTGMDYLSPQGSELNLLLSMLERREMGDRIDWAREKGAAFARSAPHKLNVFTFKDFVQTPSATRVQPPDQGEEGWKTGTTKRMDRRK